MATVVGLSAPSVYRHYANKNALLAGAVETGIEEIEAALDAADEDDGGSLQAVLLRLTAAALRRPDFWTLTQREVRHLSGAEIGAVRDRLHQVTERLAAALGRTAPGGSLENRDIAVTATLAVLSTPSVHTSRLPDARVHFLLEAAAGATLAARLPSNHQVRDEPVESTDIVESTDRATQILETAFTLFRRHGYAAVSLADIGAAIGIAGPSIYHHYGSKADLLAAAFNRIIAGLPDVDGNTSLEQAVGRYVALALKERRAIAIRATELISLPAGEIRDRLAGDHVAWTTMLCRHRPELEMAEASLLIDAARSAVHDVVRLGTLHRRLGVRDQLIGLCLAVLRSPIS